MARPRIDRICQHCGGDLVERSRRRVPETPGERVVVHVRCEDCGNGGEHYSGGPKPNRQFGPVFAPNRYATQLTVTGTRATDWLAGADAEPREVVTDGGRRR